jgi:hypothetical protein
MKSTKSSIPTLLADPRANNLWLLTVRTKTDWCEMRFTSRAHADEEYRRIKTAGTFGGQWLTDVRLEELYRATAPGAQND